MQAESQKIHSAAQRALDSKLAASDVFPNLERDFQEVFDLERRRALVASGQSSEELDIEDPARSKRNGHRGAQRRRVAKELGAALRVVDVHREHDRGGGC